MPFLRALYERLERSPFLKAVTFSEYLGLGEATPALPKVRAGSWIFGSFSTWVGHPEKNRGWDLLAATRKKLAEVSLTLSPDDAVRRRDFQKALEHVMVAEGRLVLVVRRGPFFRVRPGVRPAFPGPPGQGLAPARPAAAR